MASAKFHKNRLKDGATPTGDAFADLIDAMGGVYVTDKATLLATTGSYAADVDNPTEGEFIVGGRIVTGDGYAYDVVAVDAGSYDETNAASPAVRFLEVSHSPALLAGRLTAAEADISGLQGSAPSAAGTPETLYLQENTGTVTRETASAFSGGAAITYSLDAAPAGIEINRSTGLLSCDTNSLPRCVDVDIVVRASSPAGSATNTIPLYVGPQIGVTASNNIWGVSGNPAKIIAAATAMNASYMRFDFNLELIVTNGSGGRDWTLPDDFYSSATGADITPIFIIDVCPPWAQNESRTWQSYPDSTNRAIIATAITEAAARYPLAVWQIRNEVNNTQFSDDLTGASYVTYATDIVAAIRAANKEQTIIAQGLTNAPLGASPNKSAETFLQEMYDAGGATLFDGIACHPYVWPFYPTQEESWNGFFIMTRRLRPIMEREGNRDLKMWVTESGGPTGGDNPPDGVWTQEGQRDNILNTWIEMAKRPWTGPMLVYATMDRGADASTDTEDHYGLYEEDGTTPKLAAAVLAAIKRGE